MGDITDIIERLERARGPDRELDLAIANVNFPVGERWYWIDESKRTVTRNQYGPGAVGNPVCSLEEFTDRIDDAVVLVPAGYKWRIDSHDPTAWVYRNWQDGHRTCVDGPHPATAAIALCIAALKARAAQMTAKTPRADAVQ
jgi:hypothetical protein